MYTEGCFGCVTSARTQQRTYSWAVGPAHPQPQSVALIIPTEPLGLGSPLNCSTLKRIKKSFRCLWEGARIPSHFSSSVNAGLRPTVFSFLVETHTYCSSLMPIRHNDSGVCISVLTLILFSRPSPPWTELEADDTSWHFFLLVWLVAFSGFSVRVCHW